LKENKMKTGYKLARPDGWDFYTGNTINYRGDGQYPHTVKVPNANPKLGICSAGVGHASENPNDCFVGAKIPCSAYKIKFQPVCGDKTKWGWVRATVIEEITDLDTLFGWKYTETVNPINPLSLPEVVVPTTGDLELLAVWDSVWASVRDSVWDSVRDSVWDSVWDSVRDSVWDSVRDSVWDSVWDSVRDSVGGSVWDSVGGSVWDSVWDSVGGSVWDSVGGYIGSLFPNIKDWKYTEKLNITGYPFQSCVDLWRRGLVPSYDGKIWRLHSGVKAHVVWQGKLERVM